MLLLIVTSITTECATDCAPGLPDREAWQLTSQDFRKLFSLVEI